VILGLELTLLLYVMLAALFRLVRPASSGLALSILILGNVVLLASLNFAAFLYVVLQIGLVLALYALASRHPAHAKTIAWYAFLGLIPFNLHIWFGQSLAFGFSGFNSSQIGIGPDARIVWVVGSTFLVIKSFVMLREALKAGRIDPLPSLAGLTFLPSYTAGPIFGTKPFQSGSIEARLDLRETAKAFMLLGWGIAAFYTFAPRLRDLAGESDFLLIRNQILFAALYFDFSGYSLIAISMAKFFGVTLPQNFNAPYLATSIREFWQRWHMSLSSFIGTYLFKPFVRRTGSPQKGIFLAFVFAGLWHEVTIGYLLWGIGHGAALSLAMKPPGWWKSAMMRLPRPLHLFIGWALTMFWVASLSAFANTEWLG
jgi:D-alanyl-lipoteichoic acid acyltransferase DltB (MBOAT superfamily)